MQREIKFRVWNGSKMLGMKEIGFIPPLHSNMAPTLHDAFESMKKGMHIMQFTGLKDKTGREIYEGDVVRDHREGTKFEMKFGCSDDVIGFFGEDLIQMRYGLNLGNSEMEVIGNIYENPELLSTPN